MNKINLLQYLKHLVLALVGVRFPFETRIVHAMLLIAIVAIGYSIPFSVALGLPVAVVHYGILCLLLIFAYYLSRFRGHTSVATLLAILCVCWQFVFEYFANGGAGGSSLHSFTLVFFLTIIISPKQQYPLWLLLFIIGIPLLLYLEYTYPEMVHKVPLVGSPSYYVNIGSTYLINIAGIFLGLWYMKKTYNREKQIDEKKSEELSRINLERSKLFSILSHDLNSPLATLQTYLEMLKRQDLPPSVRAKVENELAETLGGTQELLYNILSWSKTDIQPSNIKVYSVLLKDTLSSVLRLSFAVAMQKGVTLEIQLDAVPSVLADDHLFPFVVRNVLGNAIKFSPAPGTVNLKAEKTGNHCILSIHDRGEGIPYAKQNSIFSVEVQSTLGSKGEKGTGLGLFLCKEYIQLLHGQIWFESMDSQGTTFFIRLPLPPGKGRPNG